jgi:glucokinase
MELNQYAFGIDIGGTNTKIGLFDQDGKLLGFIKMSTLKDVSPAEFVERLSQESEKLLQSIGSIALGDSRIVGVGVGAPMANYFTGRVEFAPNLGWRDVPLKKLFEDFFKCPAVIENDANLAAIGEKKWGSGKNLNDIVLVTLGTGVGTGLILEGKLYRGHDALGAEGGHILIPHSKNRPCSCGGINHLESYLSSKGIQQTIKEMTNQDWSVEELGEHFHQGETNAINVINQIAQELASGLAIMGVLFGPQAFILGGGVSKLGDSFNKILQNKLEQIIHFSLRGKIAIITATLSSDKGAVYGGAAHIFDEVNK